MRWGRKHQTNKIKDNIKKIKLWIIGFKILDFKIFDVSVQRSVIGEKLEGGKTKENISKSFLLFLLWENTFIFKPDAPS